MAISQLSKFDVQTGGLDTNGGFFVTGASGTDYSQQTTPQYSVTDGVTNGTTTITSATANFGTDVVGNGIYVQGGTGSITAGWYQIASRTNSTTIVVDRSTGLTAGTGVTLHIGGCLLTPQTALNAAFINTGAVADCVVYIKKGTYASTLALATAGSVAASGYNSRVLGYNSAHDDNPTPQSGNQPVFAVGSGAGVHGLDLSTSGFIFANITFDGTLTSGTKGTIGISATASYNSIKNCKIMNFSAEGLKTTVGYNVFYASEVTGCAGTTAAVDTSANAGQWLAYNWIHKNTKSGMSITSGTVALNNLITNNSGASSDGILVVWGCVLIGNTIYGNGRSGIRTTALVYDTTISTLWYNNILAKNGAYGIDSVTAPSAPTIAQNLNYNAFYSNTTAAYHNLTASPNDVTITTNPFNSSDANLAAETSPDWGLNNTASAGASLRSAGFPGNLADLSTTTGYQDIGAFRHQDPVGGGGTGFFIN